MIRTGLLGLGKMGISHLAIMNAHPDLEVAAICDTSEFVLDVLKRYGGFQTYTDFRELLKKESLDAVFVATPSKYHGTMVRASLEAGAHVFCEKPFCLDTAEGQQLAELAEVKRRVNQVGGSTISGGLFIGLHHEDVARFSFLLATPIIFAAAILELPQLVEANNMTTSDRR